MLPMMAIITKLWKIIFSCEIKNAAVENKKHMKKTTKRLPSRLVFWPPSFLTNALERISPVIACIRRKLKSESIFT